MPERKAKRVEPVADESFECKVTVRVWAVIDEAAGQLRIGARLRLRTFDDKPIESPSQHWAEVMDDAMDTGELHPAMSPSIPLKYFKSEDEIKAFVRAVRDRFVAYGPLLMAHQGEVYLHAVSDLQDNEQFPRHPEDVVDAPMLMTEHLRETDHILRLIYGVQPTPKRKRNGRAKWTKVELETALHEIARLFPRRARPSFQDAVEELNKRYPERALKNGEVLRQTCNNLGVEAKRFRNRGGNRNKTVIPVGPPKRNKS